MSIIISDNYITIEKQELLPLIAEDDVIDLQKVKYIRYYGNGFMRVVSDNLSTRVYGYDTKRNHFFEKLANNMNIYHSFNNKVLSKVRSLCLSKCVDMILTGEEFEN